MLNKYIYHWFLSEKWVYLTSSTRMNIPTPLQYSLFFYQTDKLQRRWTPVDVVRSASVVCYQQARKTFISMYNIHGTALPIDSHHEIFCDSRPHLFVFSSWSPAEHDARLTSPGLYIRSGTETPEMIFSLSYIQYDSPLIKNQDINYIDR